MSGTRTVLAASEAPETLYAELPSMRSPLRLLLGPRFIRRAVRTAYAVGPNPPAPITGEGAWLADEEDLRAGLPAGYASSLDRAIDGRALRAPIPVRSLAASEVTVNAVHVRFAETESDPVWVPDLAAAALAGGLEDVAETAEDLLIQYAPYVILEAWFAGGFSVLGRDDRVPLADPAGVGRRLLACPIAEVRTIVFARLRRDGSPNLTPRP